MITTTDVLNAGFYTRRLDGQDDRGRWYLNLSTSVAEPRLTMVDTNTPEPRVTFYVDGDPCFDLPDAIRRLNPPPPNRPGGL